ncbi:hypothetical protein G6F50_016170 [Rhizopus delemar]|uniref:Uncharacterized protein n=1 Tax=Rhizopus delemar TaxID=936053 RepID=A0A9P6XUR2_9FUNG|nr:hypothetical protein G6F50_016170 [Rhizopus delemar]
MRYRTTPARDRPPGCSSTCSRRCPATTRCRAAEGGIALGLHRDVLAGQRGVLPGAAFGIGLAAADARFSVHIDTGLSAHGNAHADFGAGIAAPAVVGHMRLARFQQDVTGRIQAERVARAQS